MAKIVLATFGSLGDMHPKIALGLELKTRGHDVSIAAMEFYREKIGQVGLGFSPMRPHLDPNDTLLAAELMDAVKGPEKIIKEIIFGNIRAMHDDLMVAVADADLVVTGEIVYPIKSVVELTGIKWVSTSLQPGTLFSPYDPFVPPAAPWIEHLRFMPPWFFRSFFRVMHWTVKDWYRPYREFRRDLGLGEDHDPIFADKYSELLHLVLFSRVLGEPQPDWPSKAKQTGFCFYDGQADSGQMPDELEAFLDAPIQVQAFPNFGHVSSLYGYEVDPSTLYADDLSRMQLKVILSFIRTSCHRMVRGTMLWRGPSPSCARRPRGGSDTKFVVRAGRRASRTIERAG